ncbi:MAG: hypothetical protein R6V41_07765 [Desulfobacteraceae bacterium]
MNTSDFYHILTYAQIHEILTGPVFVISVALFFAGCVFQISRFFKATTRVAQPLSSAQENRRKTKALFGNAWAFMRRIRHTVWAVRPGLMIFTTVFHTLVIITPVFLAAHNILLYETFGFCLPFFNERITDRFTWIILLSGLIFPARRLFFKNVRAVTTKADYVLLVMVFLPYLTGFLLYHQLLEFNRLIMLLHVASGEVMLVCLPFTKLVHFLYFFFNRFLMATEHSLIKGTREWKESDNGYMSVKTGG